MFLVWRTISICLDLFSVHSFFEVTMLMYITCDCLNITWFQTFRSRRSFCSHRRALFLHTLGVMFLASNLIYKFALTLVTIIAVVSSIVATWDAMLTAVVYIIYFAYMALIKRLVITIVVTQHSTVEFSDNCLCQSFARPLFSSLNSNEKFMKAIWMSVFWFLDGCIFRLRVYCPMFYRFESSISLPHFHSDRWSYRFYPY